ncbi:MAG: bifunctional diaminohydroxyphosphoribosylaminopyrimidine deaminase/5-amino-6-(5-phosphoribosylamino)uracil reductase RibD [Peptococcaceae bacterium]|nr:bifunctional diaminohydroxyphosphoribosylaminopyrimidine deaminase/5-amino-6-(5-phosphoribosylamino)uracil reductase RibD [Peptococcaceae bacterium]
MNKDKMFMKKALALAAKGQGRTSPNPMVGSLVVSADNLIIGQGYHQKAGEAHAEVYALGQAGDRAKGATLYVTLEPCCHHGLTPPCVDLIIKSGIKRVVAAMEDPNPLVSGKGLARLQQSGIDVTCGIMLKEALILNEVFIKYISSGYPFIALKAAVSLDGKIATYTGDSKWITGDAAREFGHILRDRYDGIMVGINTVLADDPMLTTRLLKGGRDPVRIILDSHGRTPIRGKVINNGSEAPTIIASTEKAPENKIERLKLAGAEVMIIPQDRFGHVDIDILMKKLAVRGITSILVEGGGHVNASVLESGLADKLYWFIAPMLIGGQKALGPLAGKGVKNLSEAFTISNMKLSSLGKDILVEGYIMNK